MLQTVKLHIKNRQSSMLDRPSKKEIMRKENEGSKRKNVYGRETRENKPEEFPSGLSFFRGKAGERFLFSTALIFWFFSIKGKEQGTKG